MVADQQTVDPAEKQNLLLNYKANAFSVDLEQKHLIKAVARLDN